MLKRLVSEQRAQTLVMAIGVMAVLSITTAATITYTAADGRHSRRSEAEQAALHLAEAGVNIAVSVLGHDDAYALSNGALDEPDDVFCPDGNNCFENVYDTGRVLWRGGFTPEGTSGYWTIDSWGIAPSPTPGLPDVMRKVRAEVTVISASDQPLNTAAWNFVFAWGTSNSTTCDMTLLNTAHIDAPLYVAGNLCLRNSSKVYQPDDTNPVTVVVIGKLEVEQGTSSTKSKVGESSASPDWILEAQIGGGCTTNIGQASHTCNPAGDGDRVWASTLTSSVTKIVTRPDAYWEESYQDANPGPLNACSTQSGDLVGVPPAFDNGAPPTQLLPGGSVGNVDLTPANSYKCVGRNPVGGQVGLLEWDAPTKTLTVDGILYVDGNVTIDDNTLVKYSGQAVLYLSGTFTMQGGSTRLCAAWVGDDCDFPTWDPNDDMLVVTAYGPGPGGDSIIFSNSVQFQGGLYAEGAIDLGNSASTQGPMMGWSVRVQNSVNIKPLPPLDELPVGAPGNPNTHAAPQKPLYVQSVG